MFGMMIDPLSYILITFLWALRNACSYFVCCLVLCYCLLGCKFILHFCLFMAAYLLALKVKDWKCNLTNKPSKAFQLLRANFVTAMVYSNENKVIDYMTRTTTSHMNEAQSKGTVNVEKMVANFPKPWMMNYIDFEKWQLLCSD